MADLIESGRNFYATKKYKRALVLFTKAMRSCPCSKGVKRDRCTCKDFEKVAAQGGSIFREAMYTCHCDVGRMFSKCDNGYHIQILDFRAATFEALGKLDHAMKDAEWILELAPRLPDGYLRVGKIARLKKHDEYAWKMYTAGIEAHKESPMGSSSKLQQLYDARKPLNRRFFRQDPLSLPPELVTHIFSYLDWTEILFVDPPLLAIAHCHNVWLIPYMAQYLSTRLQKMDNHAHEPAAWPIVGKLGTPRHLPESIVMHGHVEKDIILGRRWGIQEDRDTEIYDHHSSRHVAPPQSITQPGALDGFGLIMLVASFKKEEMETT
ncbi:uncharacterized protein CPUR_07087 [Claviceps purpurea 20.1]|uniref:F-box domain-containing protein n=1 Tax=Claviceps purpurea (strain 20.1) TaxID=1111077 RepID=M1WEX8_CLAP2|nr:uncharacterized protein CPUR_07087 [Claviceps purpurea 20.1]